MSGSMASINDVTREGTRGYLMDLIREERKLVKQHGKEVYTRFSLTAFDTIFENWLDNEPILDIDVDSVINRYQPRGGTALYDAVANTITQLDTSAAGRRGEKFLVVVMTDGQENSSREYGGIDGKNRLFKLIKSYEKRGNWTFVYLGANVDAYSESGGIGIAAANTVAYSSSARSAGATSGIVMAATTMNRYSENDSSTTLLADATGGRTDIRDDDDPTKITGSRK